MSELAKKRSEIISIVKAECQKRKLNPDLICAIIDTESSFNPYAIRYEPASMIWTRDKECAKLNNITLETERMAQKFSVGLGQVLGSTLRWLGFKGLITEQCEPKTAVYWCCQAFEKLGAKYEIMEEKIAAYNRGHAQRTSSGSFVNQIYVDRVTSKLKGVKYE